MNSIFKELLDEGRIDPIPVFECDGRKAYQFSNEGAGMSLTRFQGFADVMQAYSAFNLDKEDVDTYFEIIENNELKLLDYTNDPESVKRIVLENIQLRKEILARREYGYPLNRIFDLASFALFEEDENPLVYNEQYNKEKIKRWRKDPDVEKKIPYVKTTLTLFPSTSSLLNLDFLNSMRVLNLQNATSLRIVAKQLNSDGQGEEIVQSINSRMETLSEYDTFLTELSRNITDTQQNGDESNRQKAKLTIMK